MVQVLGTVKNALVGWLGIIFLAELVMPLQVMQRMLICPTSINLPCQLLLGQRKAYVAGLTVHVRARGAGSTAALLHACSSTGISPDRASCGASGLQKCAGVS